MIFSKYTGKLTTAELWNIRLAVFAVCSALGNALLGSLVYYLVAHERIHVIPATVTKPYWFEESRVDPEYLTQMADYYRFLALNITPQNVDQQHKEFLAHVSPEKAGDMEVQLKLAADKVKADQAKTMFSVQDVQLDREHLRIAYIGYVDTIIGSRYVGSPRKAYLFGFKYTNGRLQIDEYHETDVRDPLGAKAS
jgi:conjugal transfer pilus assembly protein TraE